MTYKVLIIGYGSAGERHLKILKNKFRISNLLIVTRRKINYKTISNLHNVKEFEPDIIVVSNSTYKHFGTINFIEKNFKKKNYISRKTCF